MKSLFHKILRGTCTINDYLNSLNMFGKICFHQHAFMLIYQQTIDMKDWWAVINNHYLNRKHHVGRPLKRNPQYTRLFWTRKLNRVVFRTRPKPEVPCPIRLASDNNCSPRAVSTDQWSISLHPSPKVVTSSSQCKIQQYTTKQPFIVFILKRNILKSIQIYSIIYRFRKHCLLNRVWFVCWISTCRKCWIPNFIKTYTMLITLT